MHYDHPIEEILRSWKRCNERGIVKRSSLPMLIQNNNQLQEVIKRYQFLIRAFEFSLQKIIKFLNGQQQYFFMVMDPDGVILSKFHMESLKEKLESTGLKVGASMAEESCGTNSIALAMRLMQPVGCLSENHFCSAFQFFSSYGLPLENSGRIIGYLNVNIVNDVISEEQIMLAELQRYQLLEEYQRLANISTKRNLNLKLSDQQINILKLLVRGFKEEMITKMLDLNLDSLRDQKMIIYKELGMEMVPQIWINNAKFKLMVSE